MERPKKRTAQYGGFATAWAWAWHEHGMALALALLHFAVLGSVEYDIHPVY